MDDARTNRRQQLLLWGAGMVGTVAIIPYAFTLQASVIAQAQAQGVSMAVIVASSIVQSALLVAVAVFVGFRAMRALGLRAPVSAALVEGRPIGPVMRPFALRAVLIGLACGAAIIALDAFLFAPWLPELAGISAPRPPVWQGMLAVLYGGIVEELLLRFFLFGIIAWGLRAATRTRGLPTWIFWTANVLSAVLFGLGHLPATAAILPLTALVVTRAILLNGVAGIAFGWLYRKDGLESGMLAHGTADVVLHVVAPLLG